MHLPLKGSRDAVIGPLRLPPMQLNQSLADSPLHILFMVPGVQPSFLVLQPPMSMINFHY